MTLIPFLPNHSFQDKECMDNQYYETDVVLVALQKTWTMQTPIINGLWTMHALVGAQRIDSWSSASCSNRNSNDLKSQTLLGLKRNKKYGRSKGHSNLTMQVKENTWPTPQVHLEKETNSPAEYNRKTKSMIAVATKQPNHNLKLNPEWVEQLMGLDIGWTDLGFWEMELSQPQQKKHSEFLLTGS